MQKKYFLFFLLALFGTGIFAQGYQITLQTPNYKKGIAYLTYFNGTNLNVQDSGAINNKGICIFKGKSKLLGGIYAIVFPGQRLRTEFLMDKEQVLTIKADTTDLVNKTFITGSKENVLYLQYQKFVAIKSKLLQNEKSAFLQATTKADSVLHERKYNLYNDELTAYREGIIKNKPSSLMAVLLSAMKEPVLPIPLPATRQDSITNYAFYKAHYWDGITFMDERVIRTPFFLRKLETYYHNLINPTADSIIKDVDYKLLLARTCPEMYKYLLNWLTDEYLNPKYMGQDAVFVHLFEKYHSKGLTNWLNDKQLEIINRRAYMLMSNLIGEKAANLEMVDSLNNPTPLYGIDADYTLVCFWDPNCGHCKVEIPKIDSIFQANWKQHNVKIYAVLTEDEKENVKPEWIKYTIEHQLTDWTHVYQTKEMAAADLALQKPSFRQLYDVTTTPTLFLLDKEKRIIAKKLSRQQLNDLLQTKWRATPSN